jgi:protein-disulfide isomerase
LVHKVQRYFVALAGAIAVVGLLTVSGSAASAPSASVLRQKVISFLRGKYAIPDTDPIQVGPLGSSQNPSYYEVTVTTLAQGKSVSHPVSISKSGRYFALSPMFYLGPDTDADLLRDTRAYYHLPAAWNLSMGPFSQSVVPDFLQATMTYEDGAKKGSAIFFVTSDKRYGVLSSVYVLRSPREVESLIDTANQPFSGSADAPVTIVEYADLECPECARMQPELENEILPQFRNKIRIIYKDFPLPPTMHPWSREAAIANECAYQIQPQAFVPYRSAIFADQNFINLANVRDQLLSLGEQVGVDRVKLASCLDSRSSLPRVEADLREGKLLQVDSTPTFFINGRIMVGGQPASNFSQAIDEALREAASK